QTNILHVFFSFFLFGGFRSNRRIHSNRKYPLSFIIWQRRQSAALLYPLPFIIYHLARLGVRMLPAACCVEEY
ncbi:MAG: hypothetical protein II422_07205, partial [Prevotella sp.]|nr:hypothetical protein [Prevotella sp.]